MTEASLLGELALDVHRRLLAATQTVAGAESLTGGLLGATLTTVSGSSASYRGGLIVYATDLKTSLAGVPEDLLDRCGAVDPEVAVALAVGARSRLGADWGLGLTGVAGPQAQEDKPVGTLHVGLVDPTGAATVVSTVLAGNRGEVRRGAVEVALRILRDRLAGRG